MGIGKKIKELRKQAGLTQPELAERVGVHETTIRRWEQERDKGPDTGMIKKIAEELNTTEENLLLDQPTDTKPKNDLVYEWGGTNRLALPNTPETRAMFERLVMCAMRGNPPATA